jgi:hypothetical protein
MLLTLVSKALLQFLSYTGFVKEIRISKEMVLQSLETEQHVNAEDTDKLYGHSQCDMKA